MRIDKNITSSGAAGAATSSSSRPHTLAAYGLIHSKVASPGAAEAEGLIP
jgi:hypothetical protein